jgi:hypothetical protein
MGSPVLQLSSFQRELIGRVECRDARGGELGWQTGA